MKRPATFVSGVPVGRQRDWIPVTTLAVPTVWMATPDGLVCIDLIAVELAANGLRKGWKLTQDEARYTASLLFDRGVPYSVIAHRIRVSGATLQAWFPEQAVSANQRLSRDNSGKRRIPTTPVKCGTRRGYRRHRRRQETPCPPCTAANTAADQHYRIHGTYVGAPEVAA
ncbi:hypothetical protein [Streptomyces prunicolor]|uniref:hypothetical protein n=1 Tax=Streptomyces prunicolor TaxID=67348 RepID=UPI00036173FB|nr:hypothetical protein [Streptomyces prunicolor]